jgi:hypothetical protein
MGNSDKPKVVPLPPLSPAELEAYLDKLRNAKPPIPGLTQEQYREYLSWRGDLQMVFTYVWDWKCATSGGERAEARRHILNVMVRANETADRFPTQPMPGDIRAPRGDKPFINIAELLADLYLILE